MSRSARTGHPRPLVAIGYQGFGNVGDEAILTGIEAILAGTDVSIGTVVCGPVPAAVAGFARARRVSSPRLLPTPDGLRELGRSGALLLSGGGLLHDHWPTVIPRYLLWIVIARLLGRRVVWLGVGVGPVRRRSQRWLVRLALRLTDVAFVRDERSAALLGGIGAKVQVVPDPAMFNEPPSAAIREDRSLAVIIRGPAPADAGGAESLAAAFVDLCEQAPNHGWRPSVLTMAGPSDAAFARLVRDVALRRGVRIEIEELGATPSAALERLARFGAAVSVRLHGLILAAVAGVPCVPVTYDAKVRAAAEDLGIGELVIDSQAMSASTVLDRLAVARAPETVARVDQRLVEIRGSRHTLGARVAAAVGPTR